MAGRNPFESEKFRTGPREYQRRFLSETSAQFSALPRVEQDKFIDAQIGAATPPPPPPGLMQRAATAVAGLFEGAEAAAPPPVQPDFATAAAIPGKAAGLVGAMLDRAPAAFQGDPAAAAPQTGEAGVDFGRLARAEQAVPGLGKAARILGAGPLGGLAQSAGGAVTGLRGLALEMQRGEVETPRPDVRPGEELEILGGDGLEFPLVARRNRETGELRPIGLGEQAATGMELASYPFRRALAAFSSTIGLSESRTLETLQQKLGATADTIMAFAARHRPEGDPALQDERFWVQAIRDLWQAGWSAAGTIGVFKGIHKLGLPAPLSIPAYEYAAARGSGADDRESHKAAVHGAILAAGISGLSRVPNPAVAAAGGAALFGHPAIEAAHRGELPMSEALAEAVVGGWFGYQGSVNARRRLLYEAGLNEQAIRTLELLRPKYGIPADYFESRERQRTRTPEPAPPEPAEPERPVEPPAEAPTGTPAPPQRSIADELRTDHLARLDQRTREARARYAGPLGGLPALPETESMLADQRSFTDALYLGESSTSWAFGSQGLPVIVPKRPDLTGAEGLRTAGLEAEIEGALRLQYRGGDSEVAGNLALEHLRHRAVEGPQAWVDGATFQLLAERVNERLLGGESYRSLREMGFGAPPGNLATIPIPDPGRLPTREEFLAVVGDPSVSDLLVADVRRNMVGARKRLAQIESDSAEAEQLRRFIAEDEAKALELEQRAFAQELAILDPQSHEDPSVLNRWGWRLEADRPGAMEWGPASYPPGELPDIPVVFGREAPLALPNGENVRLALGFMELDDALPSHRLQGRKLTKNESYPDGFQTRTYELSEQAAVDVSERALNFDPNRIYEPSPNPATGPVVVHGATRAVVSGNNRWNILAELERTKPGSLRELAVRYAERYGISPDGIGEMSRPIPVGVLLDKLPQSREQAQALSDLFNRAEARTMTLAERGQGIAANLGENAIGAIEDAFSRAPEDATLRSVLSQDRKIAQAILDDGALPQRDRDVYVDRKTGLLTKEGLELLEAGLVAYVVPNQELRGRMPAQISQKLERMTPSLVRAQRLAPGWLTPMVEGAIESEILRLGAKEPMKVGDFVASRDMFSGAPSQSDPMIATLQRVLAPATAGGMSLNEAKARFLSFVRQLEDSRAGQEGLFGEPIDGDPRQAFYRAFGGQEAPTFPESGVPGDAGEPPAAPGGSGTPSVGQTLRINVGSYKRTRMVDAKVVGVEPDPKGGPPVIELEVPFSGKKTGTYKLRRTLDRLQVDQTAAPLVSARRQIEEAQADERIGLLERMVSAEREFAVMIDPQPAHLEVLDRERAAFMREWKQKFGAESLDRMMEDLPGNLRALRAWKAAQQTGGRRLPSDPPPDLLSPAAPGVAGAWGAGLGAGPAYRAALDSRLLPPGQEPPRTSTRRGPILNKFVRHFKLPIHFGRMRLRGLPTKFKDDRVGGMYFWGKRLIQVRNWMDWQTAMHELGHAFHDRFPELRQIFDPAAVTPQEIAVGQMPRHLREIIDLSYEMSLPTEGFAEFQRLWYTQADYVRQVAPTATEKWEAWVNKLPSRDQKVIRDTQRDLHRMWWEGAHSAMRALYGPEDAPLWAAMDEARDRLRQGFADDMHGIRLLEEVATGTVKADGAWAFGHRMRHVSAAISRLEFSGYPVWMPGKEIEFRGKGLRDIWADSLGAKRSVREIQKSGQYFDARRAQAMKEPQRALEVVVRWPTGNVLPDGSPEWRRSMFRGAVQYGETFSDALDRLIGKKFPIWPSGFANREVKTTPYWIDRPTRRWYKAENLYDENGQMRARGAKVPFDANMIRQSLGYETPERAKAFDELVEFNEKVADFAQDLGIFNESQRLMWPYASYVLSFRPIREEAGTTQSRMPFRRRANDLDLPGGTQALRGNTRNLPDPISRSIEGPARLMALALENEFRSRVADLVVREMRFGKPLDQEASARRVPIEQVKDAIRRAWKEENPTLDMPDDLLDVDGMPELITLYQNRRPRGDDVMTVFREGKPTYYELTDPLVAQSVANLNRPTGNWLARLAGSWRRMFQSLVTVDPNFWASQLARDPLTAYLFTRSGHGLAGFARTAIQGYVEAIRQGPRWEEAQQNLAGGTQAEQGMQFRRSLARLEGGPISAVGAFQNLSKLDQWKREKMLVRHARQRAHDPRGYIVGPMDVLRLFERISRITEEGPRVAEFIRKREEGATKGAAAFAYNEATVDFSVRGEYMRLATQVVPFLGASVASWDRSWRATGGFGVQALGRHGTFDPEGTAQTMTRVGMYVAYSVALHLMNLAYNDEYRRLPLFDRLLYHHYFIPRNLFDKSAEPQQTVHLRQPRLYEIGSLAGMAEVMVENMLKSNDRRTLDLGASLAFVLLTNFNVNAPIALGPLLEIAQNRSALTGSPIVAKGMEHLEPFAQSYPTTSQTMQELGKASRDLPVQVNPAVGEYALRALFANWPMYALWASDRLFFPTGLPVDLSQAPIVKRLYSRENRYNVDRGEFFEQVGLIKKAFATIREMEGRGEEDLAEGLEQGERGFLADRHLEADRASRRVRQLQQEAEHLYRPTDPISRELSGEERMQRILELEKERDAIMGDFLDRLFSERQEWQEQQTEQERAR